MLLTPENVKEVTYPTEIKIDKSFVFEIDSMLNQSLIIENINELHKLLILAKFIYEYNKEYSTYHKETINQRNEHY